MTSVSEKSDKSALLLIVVIISLALISYFLLFQSEEKIELTDSVAAELNSVQQESTNGSETSYQKLKSSGHTNITAVQQQESDMGLNLLGVIVSDDAEQSSATIESELVTRTYYLNDNIASTDITLVKILIDRVLLRNKDNEDMILMLDNSAPDYGDYIRDETGESAESVAIAEQKALAKSIGNRPKELEHIVKTAPIGTSDGSEGFAVTPGLNPSLFRSAGFKEGDTLKEINGLDLSDAEQYAQAMAAIPDAHTLEFTVIRGGRTITLYLDIPSEGLSIGD